MVITLVTEAGMKRRSASRANKVWPVERSTTNATGTSGSTGVASAAADSVGKVTAPEPAEASTAKHATIVRIGFKPAPADARQDAVKGQPLVWIRASL